MFVGTSTNGTSNLLVQLGTGATPTYTTSGYLGLINSGTGATQTAFSAGFQVCYSNAAAAIWQGTLVLTLVSGNTWQGGGLVCRTDTTTFAEYTGNIVLSAALTAVRFTTVNGTDTFDAGSINILYE
jgi:hypothetical protein